MPKINITDLDEYVEEESNYEKIRSRRPKQYKEKSVKKKHREKKVDI